ncbi:MAG: hypothetical protein OEY36_07715 [Gammaproteobacteria bacterium]|nr:hypothetical protein [Gammaproteobacteria bacterium]
MHKIIKSVIGLSVAVVIMVMAYRFLIGASGTAKFGDIEITVDPEITTNLTTEVSDSSDQGNIKKESKQFVRSFDFTNHSCGTNADTHVKKCVDAGYQLVGMVGEPEIKTKDRCGSNIIGFNVTNNNCGNLTVHLQGCGFDQLNTCKGHAYLRGNIVLQGYKL